MFLLHDCNILWFLHGARGKYYANHVDRKLMLQGQITARHSLHIQMVSFSIVITVTNELPRPHWRHVFRLNRTSPQGNTAYESLRENEWVLSWLNSLSKLRSTSQQYLLLFVQFRVCVSKDPLRSSAGKRKIFLWKLSARNLFIPLKRREHLFHEGTPFRGSHEPISLRSTLKSVVARGDHRQNLWAREDGGVAH